MKLDIEEKELVNNNVDGYVDNDVDNVMKLFASSENDIDSAMKCFALSENKTPEWAKKMIKVWYNVAIAVWLAIASVTFAPISFIFRIIVRFVKHNWFALLLLVIVCIILFVMKFYS